MTGKKQRKSLQDYNDAFADFLLKNLKSLGIIIVVGLLIFAGCIYVAQKNEHQLKQDTARYYPIEKKITTQMDKFRESTGRIESLEKSLAGKAKPDEVKKNKEELQKLKSQVATGDLNKDYGPAFLDLQNFVKESSKGTAQTMSALLLTQLYESAGKKDLALASIESVDFKLSKNEVITALAYLKRAALQSDAGKCEKVLVDLDEMLKIKEFEALKEEVYLRKGLCAESLGRKDLAMQSYELAGQTSAKEKEASKDANLYLRLLKLQK